MKYCEQCGKEMSDSATFCPGCGQKVTVSCEEPRKNTKNPYEEIAFEDIKESQPYVKNAKEKKLAIVIGVLAIVACVIVGVFLIKMKSESSKKEEPNNIVEEVEEEPVAQAPVVALDNLNGTLPWEENSQKVEEFKQKSLTDYPEKKIADMFQDGETVKEWKYATYESNVYFLCNYVLQNNQAYSVIYVQNVDNSINIAELYVDDERQGSDVIVAYCDMMFVPAPVYIISDSDTRYLTREEVEALDLSLLRFARNEIFARHGRIFQDQELADYFNSQSWYEGIATDVSLSDVETANVNLIKSIEDGENEDVIELRNHLVNRRFKKADTIGPMEGVRFRDDGILEYYYGEATNYYNYSLVPSGLSPADGYGTVDVIIDGIRYSIFQILDRDGVRIDKEGGSNFAGWYYYE